MLLRNACTTPKTLRSLLLPLLLAATAWPLVCELVPQLLDFVLLLSQPRVHAGKFEYLNRFRRAGCTFFIFTSPCQVFAHDTQLSLVAGCSGCSLLSQPPLLPLQSANRDGLSYQRKSLLHLALSSSIFSPSFLLCNSLAVAASNSKLKATALLSANRRLPTLICVAIFLSFGSRTTHQFFNPALPHAFQLLFSCSHDLKQENGKFCFDFGLIFKHTSSRSMFSLSVIPVSPSLAFSNLKGDKLFADQY